MADASLLLRNAIVSTWKKNWLFLARQEHKPAPQARLCAASAAASSGRGSRRGRCRSRAGRPTRSDAPTPDAALVPVSFPSTVSVKRWQHQIRSGSARTRLKGGAAKLENLSMGLGESLESGREGAELDDGLVDQRVALADDEKVEQFERRPLERTGRFGQRRQVADDDGEQVGHQTRPVLERCRQCRAQHG